MNIEIRKSDKGYHVKDIDAGTDMCFETIEALVKECKRYMPDAIGNEVKITD